MRPISPFLSKYTMLYVRLALGITFLASVTDRFGLWGPPGISNVAWGNFNNFLVYAAKLNPYLPTAWIPAVGWGVTLAEVVCGLALLVGFQTRRIAVVSGLLLLAFALGMTMGLGIKAPFNYSVFSASAGAFLLATSADDPLSIDTLRERHAHKPTRQQQVSAWTAGAILPDPSPPSRH
jgi:thiosulfate dehydrogenase (quinone) large subunit